MGDGVLAYFGYLSAHEDDAERMVRASLGVVDAVGRLGLHGCKEGGQKPENAAETCGALWRLCFPCATRSE